MSARSKQTEDKSARSRATQDKSRKTTDRAKADAQDRASSENPVAPLPTLSQAAKEAAKEAKEAGVSPQAVMKSAPDGYASGTGEKVQLAGKADGPAVEERTTPTQDNEYPTVKVDPPHPKELTHQK